MATRVAKVTYNEDGSFDAIWLGITEADSGAPVSIPAKIGDLSVQAVGTFAGTALVALKGSNDGTNFAVMDDVSNTAISMGAATKIWRFANQPKQVKPVATAGTAASVDVYLHGAKK